MPPSAATSLSAVTISAWLSLLANAVGVVFVVVGLYRRDPWLQGKVVAARDFASGWLRRLPRRRREHRRLEASDTASPSLSAQAAHSTVRPGLPPDRDAPVEERLEWVERAVDTAFRELDSGTLRHDKNVRDLVERVIDLRAALESDVSAPRQRRDEGHAPERLEWWGVALVLVSIALAFFDAVVRSS